MKKIYAKFTKERASGFQIETSILQNEAGDRIVQKCPLTLSSEEHLRQIYKNYQHFFKNGTQILAPCRMKGNALVFDFIEGESFYESLLNAVKQKNKDGILEVLERYKNAVNTMYPRQEPFRPSREFSEVFGAQDVMSGMESVHYLDIDLTFDNMIVTSNGKLQIIDYEWMYECLIPIKFAFYRAVFAFVLKHSGQFSRFITKEEFYEFFDISKQEREIFSAMNANFMHFVTGGNASYESILTQYRQTEFKQEEKKNKKNLYAVLFVNTGKGYERDNCQVTEIDDYQKQVRISINLMAHENIEAVRIDPLNISVAIRFRKFQLFTDADVINLPCEEQRHNACKADGDVWIFDNEDPQVIVDTKGISGMKSLLIEYDILFSDLDQFACYMRPLKEKVEVACQVKERQEKIIEELRVRLDQLEIRERLMYDKLQYIEGTTAYRTLLRKKIDKISIWDMLKTPEA